MYTSIQMIDKKSLLQQLISLIQADIEKQKKSFARAKRESADAPGRMQSRYDTMGIESAWVADGLAKALNEKELSLRRLQTFMFSNSTPDVRLGSIVVVSSLDSSALEYYFILPTASGYKLQDQGSTIVTLTPITPLGKLLIGRRVNDDFDVQFPKPRTLVIEEIL
jgi:hypothetical protein